MVRGSCLCGGIRFEYARAVTQVGMCHCSKCRKVSGTGSNPVIVVPETDLRWQRRLERSAWATAKRL